jgi:uncharacterized protein (TIGR02246 family)
MKRIGLAICVVVLVFAVAIIAQTPAQPKSGSVEAKINAEIEAVREANQAWLKAVTEKDIVKVMEFYTEDAVWLFPKVPIMTGKEAIRKFWEMDFAGPDYGLAWKPVKIEVSQSFDLASSFGTWSGKIKDEKGNPVDIGGHYVVIWKKVPGGTWKVAVDTHNY